MKVTKVCCQGCGADLQIDETIRYVTCNYCNARLEIIHDTTVTHSRQLDKIERTTEDLADKMKVLELQNDIERLDREWEKFKNSVSIQDENGRISEPNSVAAIIGGVVGTAVGIFWMVVCFSSSTPVLAIVGLGFIGLAMFGMIRGRQKAAAYQTQRYRYSTARKSLLHRLEKARR